MITQSAKSRLRKPEPQVRTGLRRKTHTPTELDFGLSAGALESVF